MIKLLVADDHVILREALCEMLSGRGGYQVISQASDGKELLKQLENASPDVILLDIEMPEMDGISALAELRSKSAMPPVLILSANDESKNVRAAFKAGAQGFMPKNAQLDELQFAIRAVLEGKKYISPSLAEGLIDDHGSSPKGSELFNLLTKREVEILTHLADGRPNREIGKMLHISTRTVDTHRSNILKKLKLRTNAELVKVALSHDLISV